MKQFFTFADERLVAACVYCGGSTETRDHVPSKVLLDEPFPENLPVVPACRACNESFSLDEEYLACLIEYIIQGSTDTSKLRRQKVRSTLKRKPALASKLKQARTVTDNGISFVVEHARVENVVLKLARGHAAFELSEPQLQQPNHLAFTPLESISSDAFERFEAPPSVTILPELGSRATLRIFEGGLQWIIAQPQRYRYLAAVSDTVVVRIVIGEYLGCEVSWE